ncbi:MAG: DTW domain-containing protein [Planctomycetes bacterium]|nr:DTW domain-containing protein [Planctomycetota bacterium]
MTTPHKFILVLQHPREAKHPLGTARVLEETVPGVIVRVGLSWPNLRRAVGDDTIKPSECCVLHLGTQKDREKLEARYRGRVPLVGFLDDKLGDFEPRGLIVLDGTWQQARTLWWRNAWLLKLRRAILLSDRKSLYGRLRREPRKGCLSTFEASVLAAESLGIVPESSGFLETLDRYLTELR